MPSSSVAGMAFEVAKVRAQGEGVGTDMHELVITKRGTALIIGGIALANSRFGHRRLLGRSPAEVVAGD